MENKILRKERELKEMESIISNKNSSELDIIQAKEIKSFLETEIRDLKMKIIKY